MKSKDRESFVWPPIADLKNSTKTETEFGQLTGAAAAICASGGPVGVQRTPAHTDSAVETKRSYFWVSVKMLQTGAKVPR